MHLSPDTLALLALGDRQETAAETAHLASCPVCAGSLADLRDAVRVGRSTIDVGPLDRPNERVWLRITAELGIPATDAAEHPASAVRPARRRRRIWAVAAGMLAALLVLAGVGGVIVHTATTRPAARVEASASLAPFPSWAGSWGSAVLQVEPDGTQRLTVRVHVDGPENGAHEVWLMTGDLRALVSLGDLHDGTGVFTVPAKIDVRRYDVVDVSDEPNDGNPGHSGDSIVRGSLERS